MAESSNPSSTVPAAGGTQSAPAQPSFQQLQQQYQAAYAANPQFAQQYAAHFPHAPQQNPSPHAEPLRKFWQEQMEEIQQVPIDPTVFKNHQLPLARIKKIMKSDEDVRMISAEAPVLFAKLTLRSWYHAEENKRRTLQRNDIATAITKTDIFDFLVDIVPREDLKEGQEGGASVAPLSAPAAGTSNATATPPTPTASTAPSPAPLPAPSMPRPTGPVQHPPPMGMFFNPYMQHQPGDPNMMRPHMPGMDPSMMYPPQFMGMPAQPWPPHHMPPHLAAPAPAPPPSAAVVAAAATAAAAAAGPAAADTSSTQ